MEPPKPKRPLSAYNIFFKNERAKLLQAQSNPPSRRQREEAKSSSAYGEAKAQPVLDNQTHLRDDDKTAEKEDDSVSETSSNVDDKVPLKQKIGFSELGKKIGAKWKEISPEEHQIYNEQAAAEKERYNDETKAYKYALAARKKAAKKANNEASKDASGKRKHDGEQTPDSHGDTKRHFSTSSDGHASIQNNPPLVYANQSTDRHAVLESGTSNRVSVISAGDNSRRDTIARSMFGQVYDPKPGQDQALENINQGYHLHSSSFDAGPRGQDYTAGWMGLAGQHPASYPLPPVYHPRQMLQYEMNHRGSRAYGFFAEAPSNAFSSGSRPLDNGFDSPSASRMMSQMAPHLNDPLAAAATNASYFPSIPGVGGGYSTIERNMSFVKRIDDRRVRRR